MKGQQLEEPDQHEGAVEGDRPTDSRSRGTPTPQASTNRACPSDCDKIAEDVIGANLDETQGLSPQRYSPPAVAASSSPRSSDTCRTSPGSAGGDRPCSSAS